MIDFGAETTLNALIVYKKVGSHSNTRFRETGKGTL